MSLRIWTAGMAVAGLALYTVSFLPVSGYEPVEPARSVPEATQAELPGASMVPLNYLDPSELEFLPDPGLPDGPSYEADSLAPFHQPEITEPVRPVASAPVQPIHSHNSLEASS
jgi:hypothetical protein